MTLVIDCGNTRTRVARFGTVGWMGMASFPSTRPGVTAFLAPLLARLLTGRPSDTARPMIGLSCVVPHLAEPITAIAQEFGEVVPARPGSNNNPAIRYQPPESLGPDRLANSIAAYARYGGPCIIVDVGTALTVDALSGAGEFLGGVIFPGPAAAEAALLQSTTAVQPGSRATAELIGSSTAAGIQAGTAYGYPALIDGLVDRFQARLGGGAAVVLTGGGIWVLAEWPRRTVYDPYLTLRGLATVASQGLESCG